MTPELMKYICDHQHIWREIAEKNKKDYAYKKQRAEKDRVKARKLLAKETARNNPACLTAEKVESDLSFNLVK
jgi:hypothetical protein